MAQHSDGSLQTMAVSFVVAAVIAAALLGNFGGRGRLIDRLLGRGDDWGNQTPRVNRVEMVEENGAKMMVTPESLGQAPAPAVAAAAPAAPVAEEADPAPDKNAWKKHISGELTPYDIKGPASQQSVTTQVASDAPPAAATPAAEAAPSYAGLPTAGAHPAAAARPSYVNYGTNSRSDIMGGASGPVYNFKGKKR